MDGNRGPETGIYGQGHKDQYRDRGRTRTEAESVRWTGTAGREGMDRGKETGTGITATEGQGQT